MFAGRRLEAASMVLLAPVSRQKSSNSAPWNWFIMRADQIPAGRGGGAGRKKGGGESCRGARKQTGGEEKALREAQRRGR